MLNHYDLALYVGWFEIPLQGFDPFSTTCFRNTTHLAAILDSMATNVIIGSNMWALWPPKCVLR
jgi:hypothetical protein